MNIKTMIFAGLGLFVSMTATAVYMADDVKHMADVRKQRLQTECAKLAATATPGTPASGTVNNYGATNAPTGTTGGNATIDPANCPQPANTATNTTPGSTDPYAATDAGYGATDAGYGATDAGYGAPTDQYGTQQAPVDTSGYQNPNAAQTQTPQYDTGQQLNSDPQYDSTLQPQAAY